MAITNFDIEKERTQKEISKSLAQCANNLQIIAEKLDSQNELLRAIAQLIRERVG